MKRREFITLLGGAVVAWPLAARAQQPAMPVIGFLSARSPEDSAHLVVAFRRGLAEGGFIEGQNVTVEFRWARGQYDLLPEMAADLVARRVSVLTTAGGDPAALAAKRATSTIPIVFGLGGDPVSAGLVESFNRPGGNATGVTLLTTLMEPKRLGLLRELVPGVPLVGVLLNPRFPTAPRQLQEIEEAARTIDQRIVIATPVPTRNSTTHSPPSPGSAWLLCWSRPTHTSTCGAIGSSASRNSSACPPSTSSANMPWRADC